jgi:hypothetical protein
MQDIKKKGALLGKLGILMKIIPLCLFELLLHANTVINILILPVTWENGIT